MPSRKPPTTIGTDPDDGSVLLALPYSAAGVQGDVYLRRSERTASFTYPGVWLIRFSYPHLPPNIRLSTRTGGP